MAVSAVAQMGGPPGPEVKKLEYFLGTWTSEGTVAQGPWGAGGKFTTTETAEWMPGSFFMQTNSEAKMPPEIGGDSKEFSVMGYDTQQNVYTYDSFNSQGRHESSKGTLGGDTWTWNWTSNYGGMEIQGKMTIKQISPTSYTTKIEISMDGKEWISFMETKATKK